MLIWKGVISVSAAASGARTRDMRDRGPGSLFCFRGAVPLAFAGYGRVSSTLGAMVWHMELFLFVMALVITFHASFYASFMGFHRSLQACSAL